LINNNSGNIQVGDLVYYMDPTTYSNPETGQPDWTHVAMIVDIVNDENGNTIPYIQEVDGPSTGYNNQPIELPRSMFDTNNKDIQKISIIFMGR
jgi:hypothetical protein